VLTVLPLLSCCSRLVAVLLLLLLLSHTHRSKGDGDYEVCDDFIIDDWLRAKINETQEELVKEKECVGHLIGVEGAACRIGPGEDTMLPGEN
jgi:malate dehydrogenase (NADP+)